MNIALNGFGRIGRNVVRALMLHGGPQLRVINIGPANPDFVAHMFKYDTLMGTYPGSVEFKNNTLIIDDTEIAIIAHKDPLACNWQQYNIDWVVECTGKFTHKKDAQQHIESGAKKVLISAPAHDEDVSIIPGVNDAYFKPSLHHIVSLGSCTTNAFIPLAKIMLDGVGIEYGCMKTTHAYTNSQVLLDVEAKDLRSSRAAALNIIPTTTGASKMFAKILPELEGKISAMALRVPVAKVSLVEFTFVAQKKVSVEIINKLFVEAAQKPPLKGIVEVTDQPLVSSDFSGNNHSVIIDSLLTQTVGQLVTVSGWYDNEWGYSVRLLDFLKSCA